MSHSKFNDIRHGLNELDGRERRSGLEAALTRGLDAVAVGAGRRNRFPRVHTRGTYCFKRGLVLLRKILLSSPGFHLGISRSESIESRAPTPILVT